MQSAYWGSLTYEATPVNVVAGQTFTANISLKRAGTLSGLVNGAAAVTNPVVIAKGVNGEWHEVDLAANGTFSTDELAGGTYFIGVRAEMVGTRWFGGDGSLASAQPVTVDQADVQVNLSIGGGQAISGTIRDGSGNPSAASVLIFDVKDHILVGSGATDAAGRFTVPGLPPGRYLVRADFESLSGRVYYGGSANWFDATPVTVTAGQGADLTITANGTGNVVTITVTAPNGVSWGTTPGWIHFIAPTFGWVSADVDANGMVRLLNIPNGTYTLFVGAYPTSGALETKRTVTVSGGTNLQVDLSAAGTITGQVRGPSGMPLDGFVQVTTADGSALGAAVTNGVYTVTGVPAGPVSVRINPTSMDYASVLVGGAGTTYTAIAGATVTLPQTVVSPAGTVVGVVKDNGPVNDVGGTVQLILADGGVERELWISSNQSLFELDRLAAGTYKVRFIGDRWNTSWWQNATSLATATPVVVTAGKTTGGIDATLTYRPSVPSGTITGRVFVHGQPLADVWVTVRTGPGINDEVAGDSTAADGTFSLAVPAGTGYTLVAGYCLRTGESGNDCVERSWNSGQTFSVTAGQTLSGRGFELACSVFTDVPTPSPFCKEIAWLSAAGISTGYVEADGTRTFRPVTPVARDAMAAFMYRLKGSPAFTPPATPSFTDVPTSHKFYKEIEWLASTGVSTGYLEANGTKTFRPADAVARDAMAAFMYRLKGSPAFTAPASPSFTDVPTSHKFYKEIEWLSAAGISTGYNQNGVRTFKPSSPVNRDAMAAFMYRYANP